MMGAVGNTRCGNVRRGRRLAGVMTLRTPTTLAALAAGALLLTGCGLRGGTTLAKYEKGDTGDLIVPAPGNGTAGLYSGSDIEPNVNIQVQRGDDVGFRDERIDGVGNITAVAGDFEKNISQGTVFDRTYYWKFSESE